MATTTLRLHNFVNQETLDKIDKLLEEKKPLRVVICGEDFLKNFFVAELLAKKWYSKELLDTPSIDIVLDNQVLSQSWDRTNEILKELPSDAHRKVVFIDRISRILDRPDDFHGIYIINTFRKIMLEDKKSHFIFSCYQPRMYKKFSRMMLGFDRLITLHIDLD